MKASVGHQAQSPTRRRARANLKIFSKFFARATTLELRRVKRDVTKKPHARG